MSSKVSMDISTSLSCKGYSGSITSYKSENFQFLDPPSIRENRSGSGFRCASCEVAKAVFS